MSNKFTLQQFLNCLFLFVVAVAPHCLSAQRITSFSPASGRLGSTVTINGTGFDAVAANNIVYFGAVRATVTTASAIQLLVTVPAGATYKPISVTKGGLTAYSSRPFIATFGCGPTAFSTTMLGSKFNYSSGVFTSPASVAVGDLDGDGKPDIAVTNQDNSSISIFRNTTSNYTIDGASFAPAITFATDVNPAGIAIGDLDGDGKPDIAVTIPAGIVSVFRNTSISGTIDASSFAPRVSFLTGSGLSDSSNTSNIVIGDIDGDGKPDIAATNSNKSTVSIFRNTSTTGTINSGSFAPKVDLVTGAAGVEPIGLVVTDIDGDGKPDVAVNNAAGISFAIFRNTSTPGTLSTSSFASRVDFLFLTEIGTTNLVAGDLNNDGKPELVITNVYDNSISVYQNNTSPGSINFLSFSARVNFATPKNPINTTISDLNGDGKPDLSVMSYDTSAVNSLNNPLSVFINNNSGTSIGSSSFLTRVDFITGGSFGNIGIADFDGDGKADIAIPNYTSDLVAVLKNNASIFNSLPPATLSPSTTVCDDGVWKNIYDPANPTRIICSIRDNGINLGTTTATVYVDAVPANFNGTRFLPRHYVIKPTTQPTGSIQVRLYFTLAEFNALQLVDNRLISPDDLSITKYQGPTEDGIFNPSDATSLSIIPPSSIVYGTTSGNYYADFAVTSLSEFWFNSGNVALPVQLLYFNAEKQSNSVLLQWSTASEVNNDYFTIERSVDGSSFASIATLKAINGSSQSPVYEATDPAPVNGLNYYRLKQTDKDGKSSYSAIKTVQWDGRGSSRLMIAPQPMVSQSTVSFFAKAGKTNLSVYNAQGVPVQTYTLDKTVNGDAQIIIKKDRLAAGIYFYKIFTNSSEVYHGKLVVE